jgi:hypothetical protein
MCITGRGSHYRHAKWVGSSVSVSTKRKAPHVRVGEGMSGS